MTVCVRPQDLGWNCPLWCARLLSDEDPDKDSFDDDDTFEVEWWGSFSYQILRDNMDHSYKPICCGWRPHKTTGGGTIKRFHAFGESCNKLEGHGPCTHHLRAHASNATNADHYKCLLLEVTGTVQRAQIRLTTLGAHTLTNNGHLRCSVGALIKCHCHIHLLTLRGLAQRVLPRLQVVMSKHGWRVA